VLPISDSDHASLHRCCHWAGSTTLPVLTLCNLCNLLQDVSWRLMPGQRVGLVGANGCGKSTLLRCLSGHRRVDNGRLVVGNRVEMGYLEQTAVSGSDRTVWEEARSRMTELIEAEAAIDAASQAASLGTLQHSPPGLVTALGTQQCRCSPPACCKTHVTVVSKIPLRTQQSISI